MSCSQNTKKNKKTLTAHWRITAVFSVKCRMQRLLRCLTLRLCSYEETRNVFQLKKACVSFVLRGKKPQTNVHSWCIHFHARWTQVMIWNSVTTVPFGSATSVRHSLRQPFFRNSCTAKECVLSCWRKDREWDAKFLKNVSKKTFRKLT